MSVAIRKHTRLSKTEATQGSENARPSVRLGSKKKMKPLLKWAGGKSKVLKQFPQIVVHADRAKRVVEPFAGGAALLFALGFVKQYHINDIAIPLTVTYTAVRNQPDLVGKNLARIVTKFELVRDKEAFFREKRKSLHSSPTMAADFLFLNRTCFNGLYRENSRGRFNVPFGRYDHPRFPSIDDLRRYSTRLQDAKITTCDFRGILNLYRGPSLFVFADPPYRGTFAGYNASKFSDSDRKSLFTLLKQASDTGAEVVLCEKDHPETRSAFRGWTVVSTSEYHGIGGKNSSRKHSDCLLICNFELSNDR